MQPYESRVTRPTIEDAREYLREGVEVISLARDRIDDHERKRMLATLTEDLQDKIARNFPETDNLEYAILKCHLLVEYALERFIACMSFYRTDPDSIRLTFAQKLDVAAMLGFGAHCKRTIPSVELLNRVRNQVAHRFTIDRTVIDEIYRWWAEDPDVVDSASDIDRIGFLQWLCSFMVGTMSGELWAKATANAKVSL